MSGKALAFLAKKRETQERPTCDLGAIGAMRLADGAVNLGPTRLMMQPVSRGHARQDLWNPDIRRDAATGPVSVSVGDSRRQLATL